MSNAKHMLQGSLKSEMTRVSCRADFRTIEADTFDEPTGVIDTVVTPKQTGMSSGELGWRVLLLLGGGLVLAGTIISFMEYHEGLQDRTDRARKELIQNCGTWTLSVTPEETILTSCTRR
jgi:hypothetical protein